MLLSGGNSQLCEDLEARSIPIYALVSACGSPDHIYGFPADAAICESSHKAVHTLIEQAAALTWLETFSVTSDDENLHRAF